MRRRAEDRRLRAQLHLLDGDEVRIFSRNLENTTAMFPELAEGLVAQAGGRTVILDGEAVAYDPATGQYHPFQVTGTRKRKYGIEKLRKTLPLKLFAFDMLYLDGEDLTNLPYTERRARWRSYSAAEASRPIGRPRPTGCQPSGSPTPMVRRCSPATGASWTRRRISMPTSTLPWA